MNYQAASIRTESGTTVVTTNGSAVARATRPARSWPRARPAAGPDQPHAIEAGRCACCAIAARKAARKEVAA